MKPLHALPAGAWRQIAGVFTDIDDTLTTDGAITPDALAALVDLRAAGITVIAITGRPLGWSRERAAHWPLDAVVAENGSVALIPPRAQSAPPAAQISDKNGAESASRKDHSLQVLYQNERATRTANHARLQDVAARVLRAVPGARLATDSAGRETDIAIDHSEFAHLDPAAIDQVVALMRAEGLNASVSSIHINGWIGAHNKWQGAQWIVRALYGRELSAERDQWLFVGDSSNDVLMFQHFPHSVGVANIARFAPHMAHLPRWVARSPRGAGFAEVVRALLTDLRSP